MYKIEKNVPVTKSTKKSKYPFAEMEIGDSFLIPCRGNKNKITQRRVTVSLVNYKKKELNKTFITRKVEGGVRVWRTA